MLCGVAGGATNPVLAKGSRAGFWTKKQVASPRSTSSASMFSMLTLPGSERRYFSSQADTRNDLEGRTNPEEGRPREVPGGRGLRALRGEISLSL